MKTIRSRASVNLSPPPFASYSFARHSPEWLAEYGTLLVDDGRRMLHSAWTQTVDENGKATARLFHAQAKLRE